MSDERNILFYDGDCGFCHRSVLFLLRSDRGRRLYFAPLQGETAAPLLSETHRRDPSTLVYLPAGGPPLTRSTGALRAMADAGGPWGRLAHLALRIPRRPRDAAYDWIARHRGSLFKSDCTLPSPEQTERMLP